MNTQPTTYDVLVIGAGPAGSTAASRAAAAGLRTLLVEKEKFPRFRIGESLLPHGNALLRELGVWEKIERAGFVRKTGARFYLGDGPIEKTVVFARAIVPGLDSTYQVERARFDSILLEHAREQGAEIRLETAARSVASDADGHLATLSGPDGEQTVRARYLIDAGGRDQFYPSELKRVLDPSAFPKRIAIYNHFTDVPRDAGPPGGDTIVVRLPGGWFWIIPLSEGRTSVGLVTTVERLKSSGLSPEEHFAHVVANTPRLRRLLAGSAPTMKFHVTSDYSYYRRSLASGRVVLAGDAGGFIDPIFSSGVYLACYSAKHAAGLVVRAARENRPLAPAECGRYTKEMKSHAGVFKRLVQAFYDDDSFSVFMCPRPPLKLGPAITAIVAGHATLTWPIWWRFRLFLLVCRFQRYFPLTPRINVSTTSAPAAPAATPA